MNSHHGAGTSSSGKIASTGNGSTQAPQSMQTRADFNAGDFLEANALLGDHTSHAQAFGVPTREPVVKLTALSRRQTIQARYVGFVFLREADLA